MTGSWLAVAAAFGLVALNGFFVATEFALVKVRPTRLDELARRGSAAASRAKRLVEQLDEYLPPRNWASRWPRWRWAGSGSPRSRT